MSRDNMTKTAIALLLAASVSACATSGSSAENDELRAYNEAMEAATAPATAEQIAVAERSDPIRRASFWGEEYRKRPTDLETIVRFMKALRQIGSHERILEVVSQAYPIHPRSHEMLLVLGRSYMDQNNVEEAAVAFVRSADFAPLDDPTPLAALGVAFDRLERHDQAQEAYREALKRTPNRVSTLSNYALSLALVGELDLAETQLRKAVAQPDATTVVRQNLALVLGLQGRFDEMLDVDPSAPRHTVEANKTALKNMMTPARSYEALAEDTSQPARPTAVETMPSISEGPLNEDAMEEPSNLAATEPPTLQGGPARSTGLRPRLRGAQGG